MRSEANPSAIELRCLWTNMESQSADLIGRLKDNRLAVRRLAISWVTLRRAWEVDSAVRDVAFEAAVNAHAWGAVAALGVAGAVSPECPIGE